MATPTESETCACGQPLHYVRAYTRSVVERLIEQHGATVQITTYQGTWHVPRHYVALHGLSAAELPELAQRYGWTRLEPT